MQQRIWAIALVAGIVTIGCDNSPSTGVEGTYPLTVSITTDECTGQSSSVSSQVTIERDGDDVTFFFGEAATLTGTFNPDDRVMTVDGTILVDVPPPGTGTFPGQMHMVARVTEGSLSAVGTITFEGTFPGVSGTCRQFFSATGERENLSVFPLTGS